MLSRKRNDLHAWGQERLGDLYQVNRERNTQLIPYDHTISIATMTINPEGNGASESSLSTYKVLRLGDIAYEGHTSKRFAYGRFVLNDVETGIMSPRFTCLRPLQERPLSFWKQYIHYEPIFGRILKRTTKKGTMMNELVVDDFLNETVTIPSNEEQAKIGFLFATLDDSISLHQRSSCLGNNILGSNEK